MSKVRQTSTTHPFAPARVAVVAAVRFRLSVALHDPTMDRLMQRPECYANEGYTLTMSEYGVAIEGHGASVLVPWANVREVRFE